MRWRRSLVMSKSNLNLPTVAFDVKSDIEDGYSGYFIVAFVDLLGTDAKNAEIKAQPEFPSEMLEREVGKVKAFQRNFYRMLDTLVESAARLNTQRPESENIAIEKLRGNDVISYAFSDSIIFHASLNDKLGREVPVSSCLTIMAALVYVQLWSLSCGHPFRGGVEIGRAAVFNGNQILGPALSDAVKLEKQAQFPRIIIGEEVRKYLQLFSQLPPDAPAKHANRSYAELCRSLICESDEPSELYKIDADKGDKKSIFSLDIHSDFVVSLFRDKQQHEELVTKARNFADGQVQRFASQEGNDEKLVCHYRHLLDYLNDRAE